MKNYKIIYKRLINELQKELTQCKKLSDKAYKDKHIVEYSELIEEVNTLEWILSLCPELEGKKCNNMLFNKIHFEEWQKKIGVKK